MLEAIFLGIVQGLTEFIPVSSSGHLIILPDLLKLSPQSTAFDVFVHGGTLLALLIAYRKKIWNILTNVKEKSIQKLIINLIIATIPAAGLGLIYQKFFDAKLKSLYLAAAMLSIVGFALIYADYWLKKQKERESYEKMKPKNALVIGAMQPLAFLRGTSRSGITILAGLTQKLDLKNAVDFSFLMSIPIVGLAFGYDVLQLIQDGVGKGQETNLAVGFIAAFISGLLAINLMLKFVNRTGLKWFGVYRIALSLVILIWALK